MGMILLCRLKNLHETFLSELERSSVYIIKSIQTFPIKKEEEKGEEKEEEEDEEQED